MIVSKREEALARELYEIDMSATPGEPFIPWDRQISFVHTTYRRQAARLVSSRWFAGQIAQARANIDDNDRMT